MLKLGRKVGQELIIDGATIKIGAIRGKRVYLEVSAPKEILVLRGELERQDVADTFWGRVKIGEAR